MSSLWWKFTCCSECWDCLLRKYANNVCVLSRNVRCTLKNAIQICSLQRLFKWFILVIMLDYLVVNFSDRLTSSWRITHAHSWLSSDVYLFSICQATSVMRRLIKLEKSDSLNMTKTTHQTWRKERHLIKSDEKTSSYQIWRKRLIKLLKKKTISLLSDKQSSAAIIDVKN